MYGGAAHEPLRLSTAHNSPSGFALPRTRPLTPGNHLRDLGHPLPKRCASRRARHTPDGRRQASWGFTRHATVPQLGDGTSVLSKPRRHEGPKKVQSSVTNRMEAHAGAMRRMAAWRWGVEGTLQALKSGWPLGQRQVTHAKERGTRSVALSGLASLLWVGLSGREEGSTKAWSLFKLKERFIGEGAHEAVQRTERKWQRTFQQGKDVA